MSDDTIEFANGTIPADRLDRLLEMREEKDIPGTGNAVIDGAYELADDGYDDYDCILRKASGTTAKRLHDVRFIRSTELREKVEDLRSKSSARKEQSETALEIEEATKETFEDYIESTDWFYGFDEIEDVDDGEAVVFFRDVVSEFQTRHLISDENVSILLINDVNEDGRSGVVVEIYDERE